MAIRTVVPRGRGSSPISHKAQLPSRGGGLPARRLRSAVIALGIVTAMLAGASVAEATHTGRGWSGTWTTQGGPLGIDDFELNLAWVNDGRGSAALQDRGGRPCEEPSDYYEGDLGTLGAARFVGCTHGQRLVGRYVHTVVGKGGFDVSLEGSAFNGRYQPDQGSGNSKDNGASGAFTGTFKAHTAQDCATPTQHPVLCAGGSGESPTQRIGIGIVPYLYAGRGVSGDKAERVAHQFVGAFPEVKKIYNAPTPAVLFNIVRRQAQLGRRADLLVIGGHGSQDTPYIDLPKADLHPQNVDLPMMRRNRQRLEDIERRGITLPPDAAKLLAEYRADIAFLESVSEGMNAGADVLLLNCSPGNSPAGRQFVKNLGEVLLGKRGGTIKFSTIDLTFKQVQRRANKIEAVVKTGKIPDWGDWFISEGRWEKFVIPPRPGP